MEIEVQAFLLDIFDQLRLIVEKEGVPEYRRQLHEINDLEGRNFDGI